ncbi:MAG: radical SAM protein [Deltaproteobacteria bacterium]|nr:radical SAM protein [Deltaproteobacteria bacterium]
MENLCGKLTPKDYTPDLLWEKFRVTPELLQETDIIESSVYLTRQCNLKCQYCKIIKTELPQELSTDQWIEVFNILEGLGIRFINIAGGEPTVVDGLGKLIRHLNNTSMEYSIVSNSVFNDKKLKEMVDAGLKAYVASIDVIGGKNNELHDLKKSSAGMKMLKRLKALGVPYLCANIVISGTNISNVADVVKCLCDDGIWVNICPVIWGKGDNWDKIDIADKNYRLMDEHRERLKGITEEILAMKRQGATILPTESYIKGIPDFGVDLNWKCFSCKDASAPPRLTIDADGGLMNCINVRGKVAQMFTIFDIRDKGNYQRFKDEWWKEAKDCSGCYWSTMVMAKERQELLKKVKEGLWN